MKIRKHLQFYNFVGDTESGITLRWGKTIQDNPVSAPWPELADISISNYCTKQCDFCYRESTPQGETMSLQEYEFVLDSLTHEKYGSVFQVALGGGEPLEHPNFMDIIEATNERGIIVNFTTNAMLIDLSIASFLTDKVGAIAISVKCGPEIPVDKIKILVKSGIKVNLHYILDSTSLEDAICLLNGVYNDSLAGVNSVIFLTYKPKGRATADFCLEHDEKLEEFLKKIEDNNCSTHLGFDACFVPTLMHNTSLNTDYMDSCECGFFSVYVDEKLNVKPCSFTVGEKYVYNLKEYDFSTIWNEKYESYRNKLLNYNCTVECEHKKECRGNCSFFPELDICSKKVCI